MDKIQHKLQHKLHTDNDEQFYSDTIRTQHRHLPFSRFVPTAVSKAMDRRAASRGLYRTTRTSTSTLR